MSKYFQAEAYTDGIYWGSPNFKKVLKNPEKVLKAILKAYNEGYSKGAQEGGGSQGGTTLEPIEITVIEKLVSTQVHELKLNQSFDVTTTYITDANLGSFLNAIYAGDNTFAPITINNFDGVSGRTAQSFAIAVGKDNKVYGDYILPNNEHTDFCILEEKPQDTLSYTKIETGIAHIEDVTGQDIYYKYYPNGTSPIGGDDTLPVVWSWDGVLIGDVIGVVLVHLSEGTQAFSITVTDIHNATNKITAQFGDSTIGTIIVSGEEDNVYGDSTLSFSCPYPVEIHIYTNIYTEPELVA